MTASGKLAPRRDSSAALLSLSVFISLSVLSPFAGAQDGSRPCDDSGMCSLGISKFYTGDIAPSENFRALLEAVSFKKEVIITSLTETSKPPWVDLVVQMYWELQTLGFGHFVVLGTSIKACTELHRHVPQCSCVWDSSPMDLGDGGPAAFRWNIERLAWFYRWKFFARAGRLGYNVMNVDSDFVFFRDPYKYIKEGPMSQVQMWCNPEGGGPMHCNGGFTYIQNTKPDGPVTWVFKNLVDEQMWMADDNYEFVRHIGGGITCHTFDQTLIYDGVQSAFAGRPLIPDSVLDCRPSSWVSERSNGQLLTKDQVLNNIKMVYGEEREFTNVSHIPLPKDWTDPTFPVYEEFTRVLINRLTVPNMAYGYPPELGGTVAPLPRGNFTAQWIAMLKSDCPECPWWDDTRPIKGGKDQLDVVLGPNYDGTGGKWEQEFFWDDKAPVELIAVGPAWLSNSILGQRMGMCTGKGERMPAPFAMTHIHYWVDVHTGHKGMVRKVVGRYNWTLAMSVFGPQQTPYVHRHSVHRVLVLHPSINLARTRSMEEYNTIVLGLMLVAHFTHRTAVIPDVPCGAPWLHSEKAWGQAKCRAPLNILDERYSSPTNLPYPADSEGMLIGGWWRRLLAAVSGRLGSSGDRHIQPQLDEPTLPLPPGLMYETSTKYDMAASSAQKPASKRRRGLMSYWADGPTQHAFWDSHRRMKYSMSYTWEPSCLEHVEPPFAMVQAEYGHWITTEAAKQAQRQPSDNNTLFYQGASSAFAIPPLTSTPNGSTPETLHHYVLKPDSTQGWSVYDSMLLVPVGQLMREAARHSDQPLLYLGHPLGLVSSTERHKRGDTHDHGGAETAKAQSARALRWHGSPKRRPLSQEKHMYTVQDLDDSLAEYVKKMTESDCGLTKKASRSNDRISWDFAHAKLTMVKEGKLMPVAGSSSSAPLKRHQSN